MRLQYQSSAQMEDPTQLLDVGSIMIKAFSKEGAAVYIIQKITLVSSGVGAKTLKAD